MGNPLSRKSRIVSRQAAIDPLTARKYGSCFRGSQKGLRLPHEFFCPHPIEPDLRSVLAIARKNDLQATIALSMRHIGSMIVLREEVAESL